MRVLKDQLAAYTNKFQTDWDDYLGVVAGAYRMTVNEATGYSPFYLVYGREAEMPHETHVKGIQHAEGLSEYAEKLATVMAHTWESVSKQQLTNVDAYNKRPREPLKFKPYEVGEYFMLKRQPKRFYMTKSSRVKMKLCAKLQYRWVGPYRITRLISPVLYEADIHGRTVRVHAVNMKPKTENWMKKSPEAQYTLTHGDKQWLLKKQRDQAAKTDEDGESDGGHIEEDDDQAWGNMMKKIVPRILSRHIIGG